MEGTNTPGSAAPSTPSATPTPASTPAPQSAPVAATPVATPGAPATSTPSTPDTRSTEQILRDKMAAGLSAPPEPNPEAGEPAPTTETPTAETPAPEQTPTPETTPEQTPEEPAVDFDLGGYGADAVAAVLAEDPAIQAALEANPEAKPAIYANARKAARAVEYDTIIGSPEDAKLAVQSHESLSNIGNLLADVADANFGSVDAVVSAMRQQTMLRDENGQPVLDDKGQPRTDGTVGRFFKNFYRGRLEYDLEQARAAGDEDTAAALEHLMERKGFRGASNPGSEEGVSEEVRQREEALAKREQEFNERTKTQEAADLKASDARVESQTDATLTSTMKSILDKATGLTAFERGNVEKNISKGLSRAIRDSATYKAERRRIESKPLNQARETELVKLNNSYIARHLPSIAQKVLADAGVSIQTKAAARTSTQTAREQASRSEHRGSLAPASPQAAPGRASMAETEAALAQKLGRKPSVAEVLKERMTVGMA